MACKIVPNGNDPSDRQGRDRDLNGGAQSERLQHRPQIGRRPSPRARSRPHRRSEKARHDREQRDGKTNPAVRHKAFLRAATTLSVTRHPRQRRAADTSAASQNRDQRHGVAAAIHRVPQTCHRRLLFPSPALIGSPGQRPAGVLRVSRRSGTCHVCATTGHCWGFVEPLRPALVRTRATSSALTNVINFESDRPRPRLRPGDQHRR
jgi:hypothetical protein